MLKTYKVKHGLDLEPALFERARAVAAHVLEHGPCSTAAVKHIGLKAEISNQIIRKYGNDKKLKRIKLERVKLIVPGCGTKLDKRARTIRIRTVKGTFPCWFPLKDVSKVNQVELSPEWAWVTVTLPDVPEHVSEGYLGIDLNSTSHSIVVACPATGKVQKYGKQIPFLKKKYRNIRSKLQRQGRYRELKRAKRREHDKTTDVIRKVSLKIVTDAARLGVGIKLEDLTGIRKDCTRRGKKNGNHTLNSWPFYQVRLHLTQKAKEHGVELMVIDPRWTSQQCSQCGCVDKSSRHGKQYVCAHCAHVDHADVNAAFNIASRPKVDPPEKGIRRKGQKRGTRSVPSLDLESRGGNVNEDLTTPKPSGLVPEDI